MNRPELVPDVDPVFFNVSDWADNRLRELLKPSAYKELTGDEDYTLHKDTIEDFQKTGGLKWKLTQK